MLMLVGARPRVVALSVGGRCCLGCEVAWRGASYHMDWNTDDGGAPHATHQESPIRTDPQQCPWKVTLTVNIVINSCSWCKQNPRRAPDCAPVGESWGGIECTLTWGHVQCNAVFRSVGQSCNHPWEMADFK